MALQNDEASYANVTVMCSGIDVISDTFVKFSTNVSESNPGITVNFCFWNQTGKRRIPILTHNSKCVEFSLLGLLMFQVYNFLTCTKTNQFYCILLIAWRFGE